VIGLLDAHDQTYAEVAKLCRNSKIKYCKIHKYEFVEHIFDKIPDRTSHWGRILAIKANLNKFDWLLYLDTDTIITNFKVKIEEYIDTPYDIIVGRMPKFLTGVPSHLSTSAILIRNSPWVYDFLDLWYAQNEFIDAPYHASNKKDRGATLGGGGMWFEQSAYQYLYDTNDDCYAHTCLMHDDWFNSREVNHTCNDFLIHITSNEHGLSNKIQRIKTKLRQMITVL
jgi:hypothetical protein